MPRRPARILLGVALAVLVALLAIGAAAGLYTDALWYSAVGYSSVFWTRLGIGAVVRVGAAIVGAAVVLVNLWLVTRQLGPVHLRRRYGNLEIAEMVPRSYLVAGIVVASLLAGWWLAGLAFGGDASLDMVAWLRQVRWGVADPLFGNDLSFYVFSLPAYFRVIDFLVLSVVWSFILLLLGYTLVGAIRWKENRLRVSDPARVHLMVLAAGAVLLLAVRYWIDRYALLLQGNGFQAALGYTDVHARLPARLGLSVLSVLAAGTLVYGAVRRVWLPPVIALGVLMAGALLAGNLYPAAIERFRVEPNQLDSERPYIGWSIDYTLRAYGLDQMKRVPYHYQQSPLPGWEALAPAVGDLPLWDPEPLETVYNAVQTLYPYYHFADVDFDRYATGSGRTQVAIAAREFAPEGLTSASRSWVSTHLNPKYIRGLGDVVSPADAVAPAGGPLFWLQNVDPVIRDSAAAPPAVALDNPDLFITETASDYVLLVPGRGLEGTPGRDYPLGVLAGGGLRRLAFAWRFGDKNLLFSGDLTGDSRIVFRRSVRERLQALAPFLIWDPDAYPVLMDGHTVWVADGYSAATTFPLSRPVEISGVGAVRYLRNSVKATIDAVTGAVRLYAVGQPDPVLETYRSIFPGLVAASTAMPPELRAHIRYPRLIFNVQAKILREYHVTNADRFYAGQDVWELPPEGTSATQTYQPMYTTMRLPGAAAAEFLLSTPFIARERQSMTALLIARSDAPHYGELMLYELPRDQQVPGPGQVQSVIEQDPTVSPQLTLWRQAGSDVDLGHLRVVPLGTRFLYVQPLFLSAQGSPIPELERVIVSDGAKVAMASSLADAVEALHGMQSGEAAPGGALAPAAEAPAGDLRARAIELMDRADRALRTGDFAGFGAAWRELRGLLQGTARTPQ